LEDTNVKSRGAERHMAEVPLTKIGCTGVDMRKARICDMTCTPTPACAAPVSDAPAADSSGHMQSMERRRPSHSDIVAVSIVAAVSKDQDEGTAAEEAASGRASFPPITPAAAPPGGEGVNPLSEEVPTASPTMRVNCSPRNSPRSLIFANICVLKRGARLLRAHRVHVR
jgi:hypothetical protein